MSIIDRAVQAQRRGLGVDAMLTKAAGRHGTTFERLRRYKRLADAVCRRLTAEEIVVPKEPAPWAEDLVCECGRDDFSSFRALRIHQGLTCGHHAPDPRMAAAVSRYEDGEPVMQIIRDVGISAPTLYEWLKYSGVPKRQPKKRGAA